MTRAFVLLGILGSADFVHADSLGRFRLAEDGEILVLLARDEPQLLTISGTVTTAIDGRELDGGTLLDGGLNFVLLPMEAHLWSADPTRHRYEYVIPEGVQPRAWLHTAGLASRHLVTTSQAADSLTGAIFVELETPPPPVPARLRSEKANLAPAAALGVPVALVLAFLQRRRAREERRLERRVVAASRRIACEAAPLGPAYAAVVESARAAVGAARDIRRTAEAARRARLPVRRDVALTRLRVLATLLEDAAATLASQRVGPVRSANDVQDRLQTDLDAAVQADREVDAI